MRQDKSSFWATWKSISDTLGQLSSYFQGRHITTLHGTYLVKSGLEPWQGCSCLVSHTASDRTALPFSSHPDNSWPVVWPQLPELHWDDRKQGPNSLPIISEASCSHCYDEYIFSWPRTLGISRFSFSANGTGKWGCSCGNVKLPHILQQCPCAPRVHAKPRAKPGAET